MADFEIAYAETEFILEALILARYQMNTQVITTDS